METAPERFTIVPDDYHVPYAGTAEDGRRFFLSDELFTFGSSTDPQTAYVGLFLWNADGTFDEVRVDYVLEPIEVAPFTTTVGGVDFGWRLSRADDGSYQINIEPGDFIAYYAPWDGLEYDT